VSTTVEQPPADLRIRLATGFLVVVFVLVAVAPTAIFMRLRGTENRLVDQIGALALSTQRVARLMDDQETGERGYLLTGDTSSLEPYATARAQLDAELNEAAAQAKAVGGQAPQLVADLRAAAVGWQTETGEPAVALRQNGQTALAIMLETSGQGKVTFDRVRQAATALENYTTRLQKDETRRRDEILTVLSIALVLLAVLGLIGIGLLYYIAAVSRGYIRRAAHSEAVVRAKDEFLALASHELKTPLATIKGQAQASLRRLRRLHTGLSDDQPTPLEPAEYQRSVERLEAIDRQSGRMARLVEEMVDASRIEGRQLRLRKGPLDMVQLTRRTLEQLQPLSPGHELRLTSSQQAVTVFADDGRIEQVLNNLISNAVKYSPEGRSVEVAVRVVEHDCVCAVTDHGIGVPKAEQRHLFGRFYRASNVSASSISGLGMGLYICRAIVEGHGGQIWIDSAEGKGSTFSFSIPLVRPN
jgi:signal transduction histidine kinase